MTTPPPLTDNDYRALALFRRTLRHFLHFSNEAAGTAGLEPQQYQAMLALRAREGGSMTVGELAEELMIRPHSSVGLVTRLERQELVAREKGAADRRQVFVVLTARGDALLSGLAAAHKDELRKAVPALRTLVDQLDGVSSPA